MKKQSLLTLLLSASPAIFAGQLSGGKRYCYAIAGVIPKNSKQMPRKMKKSKSKTFQKKAKVEVYIQKS
jgi:hypothetical protein